MNYNTCIQSNIHFPEMLEVSLFWPSEYLVHDWDTVRRQVKKKASQKITC